VICPNCGRRNSAGATFCSRCRQRLPLATKLNGHRRAVIVEPRGGGGSGAAVLGVALLAGFLFVGGAAAIYLASPPADPDDSGLVAGPTGEPTLPPFVQLTASPAPTPSPSFILLPSDSMSPSPSASVFGTPAPVVTQPPSGPTPQPTPRPVVARFQCAQVGDKKKIQCDDNSKGNPTQWLWDFGDGQQSTAQNPPHSYDNYGTYTVQLTVTGPGGTSTETHQVTIDPAPTAPPPTPSPAPTVAPTEAPTTAPPSSPLVPTSTESPETSPST
jgi:hypothetical protein